MTMTHWRLWRWHAVIGCQAQAATHVDVAILWVMVMGYGTWQYTVHSHTRHDTMSLWLCCTWTSLTWPDTWRVSWPVICHLSSQVLQCHLVSEILEKKFMFPSIFLNWRHDVHHFSKWRRVDPFTRLTHPLPTHLRNSQTVWVGLGFSLRQTGFNPV